MHKRATEKEIGRIRAWNGDFRWPMLKRTRPEIAPTYALRFYLVERLIARGWSVAEIAALSMADVDREQLTIQSRPVDRHLVLAIGFYIRKLRSSWGYRAAPLIKKHRASGSPYLTPRAIYKFMSATDVKWDAG